MQEIGQKIYNYLLLIFFLGVATFWTTGVLFSKSKLLWQELTLTLRS